MSYQSWDLDGCIRVLGYCQPRIGEEGVLVNTGPIISDLREKLEHRVRYLMKLEGRSMGILEEINNKLDQIIATIGGGALVGGSVATTSGASTTSSTTVEELIPRVQKLAQNPASMAKIREYLTSIGLNRLTEAKPAQVPGIAAKVAELEAGGAAEEELI